MQHSTYLSLKKALPIIAAISLIFLATGCEDTSAQQAKIEELNKSIKAIDYQIYDAEKSLEQISKDRSWVGNLMDQGDIAKPYKDKLKELEKERKAHQKSIDALYAEIENQGFSFLDVIMIVIASIVVLAGLSILLFIARAF